MATVLFEIMKQHVQNENKKMVYLFQIIVSPFRRWCIHINRSPA